MQGVANNGHRVIGIDSSCVSTSLKTQGVWTWERGDKRSVTDFIVVEEEQSGEIQDVRVDDVGEYDLNSDHNIIIWTMKKGRFKERERTKAKGQKPGLNGIWSQISGPVQRKG